MALDDKIMSAQKIAKKSVAIKITYDQYHTFVYMACFVPMYVVFLFLFYWVVVCMLDFWVFVDYLLHTAENKANTPLPTTPIVKEKTDWGLWSFWIAFCKVMSYCATWLASKLMAVVNWFWNLPGNCLLLAERLMRILHSNYLATATVFIVCYVDKLRKAFIDCWNSMVSWVQTIAEFVANAGVVCAEKFIAGISKVISYAVITVLFPFQVVAFLGAGFLNAILSAFDRPTVDLPEFLKLPFTKDPNTQPLASTPDLPSVNTQTAAQTPDLPSVNTEIDAQTPDLSNPFVDNPFDTDPFGPSAETATQTPDLSNPFVDNPFVDNPFDVDPKSEQCMQQISLEGPAGDPSNCGSAKSNVSSHRIHIEEDGMLGHISDSLTEMQTEISAGELPQVPNAPAATLAMIEKIASEHAEPALKEYLDLHKNPFLKIGLGDVTKAIAKIAYDQADPDLKEFLGFTFGKHNLSDAPLDLNQYTNVMQSRENIEHTRLVDKVFKQQPETEGLGTLQPSAGAQPVSEIQPDHAQSPAEGPGPLGPSAGGQPGLNNSLNTQYTAEPHMISHVANTVLNLLRRKSFVLKNQALIFKL